ncbi:chorismate mutase [Roseobacteraceae bacterium NS-SX3]
MTELTPAGQCNSMPELRQQIDKLDQQLIALLAARAGYIDRAVQLKTANGWPARIPERVDEVITNACQAGRDAGLDPDLVERLWRQLVEWSIAREARVIPEV